MNQQFKNNVFRRSLAIQGLSVQPSSAAESPLPIFSISDRRTITRKDHTIIEQGKTNENFDSIDITTDSLPSDHNIALLTFEVTTDFWYGFGKMKLSDTCLLVYEPEENIQSITWEQNGTEVSPKIEYNTYTLTKDGKQSK